MVVTADPMASNSLNSKKLINGPTKYSQTIVSNNRNNPNLYSMIYQNRSKNLVSSYLKNVDST